MNKEEILAKRITKFPESGDMTDEAIKRNVYAAMEEYASQQPSLRWKELKELISLAEDGYKLHQSNAVHLEFLKEDRMLIAKAKQWLSESSPTPKQEDEVADLSEQVSEGIRLSVDNLAKANYWKQRCEAAEKVISSCLSVDFAIMNFPQEEFDIVSNWQDLKNKQSLPKQSQDANRL